MTQQQQGRIKADAKKEYPNEIAINPKLSNVSRYRFGYIAGATAEVERAQVLVDALNMAKKEIVAMYKQKGYSESFVTRTIDEAMQKWEENIITDPCPHCGKELHRDRNLCCRECGKEVENKAAGSEKPTLTQSRADFIREVNDRDVEGMEVIEFAEWFWGYCKEYRRSGTYVTNFNEVMTVKELYELFKQQKDK